VCDLIIQQDTHYDAQIAWIHRECRAGVQTEEQRAAHITHQRANRHAHDGRLRSHRLQRVIAKGSPEAEGMGEAPETSRSSRAQGTGTALEKPWLRFVGSMFMIVPERILTVFLHHGCDHEAATDRGV
jgi:hypothetical protein